MLHPSLVNLARRDAGVPSASRSRRPWQGPCPTTQPRSTGEDRRPLRRGSVRLGVPVVGGRTPGGGRPPSPRHGSSTSRTAARCRRPRWPSGARRSRSAFVARALRPPFGGHPDRTRGRSPTVGQGRDPPLTQRAGAWPRNRPPSRACDGTGLGARDRRASLRSKVSRPQPRPTDRATMGSGNRS
jgi:hypothetical protein